MLVLTRHVGQEIVIGNNIRVVLLEVRGEQARIGIDAPPSVRVDRLEVQLRRLPVAHIGEDQTQILVHRVALDPDALAEGLRLGRLLGALAVGSVFPTVVEAANLFTLDPPSAELRPRWAHRKAKR